MSGIVFADSHLHLTSPEYDADREEVISRAMDSGVRLLINPGVDLADSRRAVELAERHDGIYACVGVHPHEAAKAPESDLRAIEELAAHPKVVAIGEIGLDYYYDFSPPEVQQRVYRDQIGIARRTNLPIVIHTRDSIDDTVRITAGCVSEDQSWRAEGRGVFHCFSGDVAVAEKVLAMGFRISFPGMITFRNAATAQEVATRVPLTSLLLETDSPWLAPVPHRGTRNEPSRIPLIAQKLSDLRGVPVEEVAASTTHNTRALFEIR